MEGIIQLETGEEFDIAGKMDFQMCIFDAKGTPFPFTGHIIGIETRMRYGKLHRTLDLQSFAPIEIEQPKKPRKKKK